MINKKNLWFLTLFSLVLVLSIYYVTMPNDLLAASTSNTINKIKNNKILSNIEESDTISTLKIEDDSNTNDELDDLQKKLTNSDTTTEEKNKVYEKIKTINTNSSIENTLEDKIDKTYNCKSFTKIEDTAVKVVVDKCENSKTLANNIMRLVQEQFEDKMYVTVQFSK